MNFFEKIWRWLMRLGDSIYHWLPAEIRHNVPPEVVKLFVFVAFVGLVVGLFSRIGGRSR